MKFGSDLQLKVQKELLHFAKAFIKKVLSSHFYNAALKCFIRVFFKNNMAHSKCIGRVPL